MFLLFCRKECQRTVRKIVPELWMHHDPEHCHEDLAVLHQRGVSVGGGREDVLGREPVRAVRRGGHVTGGHQRAGAEGVETTADAAL